MSRIAETTSVINYPIPYMGLDWSVPYTEVQHPYCPMLLDFTANGESLEIVDGTQTVTDYGVNAVSGLKVPVASNLLLVKNPYDATRVYTVNTSSFAFTAITSAPSTALAALLWYDYCDYVDRTFIYTTNGDIYSYSAGTITAAFTIARPPNATLGGGICSYRDRIIAVESKVLYFGAVVGAVSGALSSLNLASVIGDTSLISVRSLSTSGSLNVQDYLVLLCANGKLLIYTGDFPGSANWQLVSIIPPPQGYQDSPYRKLVQLPGDLLYFDGLGCQILSVRQLLESGLIAALTASPIAKISKFLAANGYTLVSPIYDGKLNRLLFITAPNTPSYAITSKGFLGAGWYDHYIFAVELNSNAISLYSPPLNSESGLATYYYRFADNDSFCLVQGRDGKIYCSSADSNLFQIFVEDGFYSALENNTIYPTIYMPYSELDVSANKLLHSCKIVASADTAFDYSLYFDFDFKKLSIASSEQTEFKYIDSDGGTKLVNLPISGTGDFVAPCLQTRFTEDFALHRITLQLQIGGV